MLAAYTRRGVVVVKKYNFAFYTSDKVRTQNWGNVIAAGAAKHGDIVVLEKQTEFTGATPYDGGGNIGLARACKRIMEAYLQAGKHFLLFDKGYWGRNVYWRVSVDGWQPNKYFRRFSRGTDRLERLVREFGFTFKDRREVDADAPILFAGSCQNYANFLGLGDVNEYNLSVLNNIRANSLRRIIYRPNPSWYRKHNDEFKPIHKQVPKTDLSVDGNFIASIEGSHLVVTHGTGAAVTATQYGVPSLVIGDGVAKSISMGPEWNKIEEPYFPLAKERWQFYADLAYCQWTTDEFVNGVAWQEIRDILSFLEGPQTAISLSDLARQYRIMHSSSKYFRGIGTVNYQDDIGELINKTASTTLLDYGSGKGEQYQSPYELQTAWGVRVTCYDPGVPEFSDPPNIKFEKFDGVICCDVMEHIPDDAIDKVLGHIFSLAKLWVFFVITTVPAKKNLPDGRNCHVAVHDSTWWKKRITKLCPSTVEIKLIFKGDDREGE